MQPKLRTQLDPGATQKFVDALSQSSAAFYSAWLQNERDEEAVEIADVSGLCQSEAEDEPGQTLNLL